MWKIGDQIHANIIYINKSKCEESSYKKQSGWYNVVLGEDEYISLQKITSIYVTTIHLKWYSKISIYVALVKSETQESTGFFLDKTKIKPLPRATEVEWKQSK